MAAPADVPVGIDVAKARLDVAAHGDDLDGPARPRRPAAVAGAARGAAADPQRAGSQRWLRAGRGRRPERRWPASRRRQSAPDSRLRPRPLVADRAAEQQRRHHDRAPPWTWASTPWPPPCGWPKCPNWAPAPASRSPPASGSRPATATAAPGAGGGVVRAGALRSAPRSPWPP